MRPMRRELGTTMIEKFEEFQKLSKDNAELAAQSFATFQKGAQAIAVEVADYSKKSFEEGSAAFEKLLGAKSLDKAIEVQTTYFKGAYEAFVAQATKLGTLYSDVAKDAYKPYEGVIAKATTFKI
jgi:hypothetical protein